MTCGNLDLIGYREIAIAVECKTCCPDLGHGTCCATGRIIRCYENNSARGKPGIRRPLQIAANSLRWPAISLKLIAGRTTADGKAKAHERK